MTSRSGSTRRFAPLTLALVLLALGGCSSDGGGSGGGGGGGVPGTRPTIVSIDPPDGASGVARTVRIRARFSREMNAGTLGPPDVTMSPSPQWTSSWDGATDTFTILPRRRLDCGVRYTVTFGTGVRDVAGYALAAPVSSSFTVHGDCDEPRTTASVQDGVYTAPQSVTLSCTDGSGSGCARIVYTLDGSVPSLDPVNGTVVNGAVAASIPIGLGDTALRFHAEDLAGNREAVREERYSISTTGFTYVATGGSIARGMGPVPASFVAIRGGGVTSAFFRDATNGRLYRAAQRALFASDDGVSWTRMPVLEKLTVPAEVTAVYAQGSLVFAGTSQGLFRSDDGGATFVHLDALRFRPPWILDIDGEGKHVYVGSDGGIRISHDRGETFVESEAQTYFRDVDVEPSTGKVFLATSAGLGVTSHLGGGITFFDTITAPGLPTNAVRDVVVTPGTVYAATEAGFAIFTRDGAGNPVWSVNRTIADGLGDDFVSKIAVEGSTVFAVTGPVTYSGSTNSFCVSTDGGVRFSPRQFAPPDDRRIAAAVHVEGTNVYVGAHPGWFLSTDGGLTFAQKDFPGAGSITGSGSTLYAGRWGSWGDDGLLVSSDGFRTFLGRGEQSGMGCDPSVSDVSVSGSSVYAATFCGLAISTDGGNSFVLRSRNSGAGLWSLAVMCVAVQPGKIWAGSDNSIDLSTNGGATFANLLNMGASTAIEVAASGSNVYLANTNDVRVTNDGGTTFATRGLPTLPQDLALAPDGAVYVATNGGVFVSRDSGATFSRIAGVPATTWVYSVDATAGALYVGILDKLGISVDGGQTFVWRDASHGVAGTPAETWYQP